ncbi:Nicotinate-nucleotide adenylyltransferase [Pirellulimonas nuda]|uniref:Probable nicotinate-nucleotide adenylyltransferase n=1 Tax=Pirellulimonas nuda TaxID=2528009 RepID=A0A518D9C3_9BACT|nr:nicotinate-nucleotide adenylyltransferase [Pirellulimonas nuda]QDU88087.1 Nicotinate-nucleotide adenylyltransferase [Pirellulimonas nuda]
MRLGLFGGSFDPIHNGHLAVARACYEQASLDGVCFIPSAVQPHKPDGPQAGDEDRWQMLLLALEGRAGFSASRIELDRGGVSFTVQTLRTLRAQHERAELFFLLGADTLLDLPNWREPEEVLRLATPLVVCRPGQPAPDRSVLAPLLSAQRLAAISGLSIAMPPNPASSSEVRRRVGVGEPIDDLVPIKVARYIGRAGLYRQQR